MTVNGTVTLSGFVSAAAVETFATIRPQPQDKKVVVLLILPAEKYDMERGAVVGIGRGCNGGSRGRRCTVSYSIEVKPQ